MMYEILYPLPSVSSFINEDLKVYPANQNGEPDITRYNMLENLASEWVTYISPDDDNMVSELIFWSEDKIYYI
jgi:hypothetical protein